MYWIRSKDASQEQTKKNRHGKWKGQQQERHGLQGVLTGWVLVISKHRPAGKTSGQSLSCPE
jgi:hypothetical protein